jgi:hypothetical protein
MGFYDEIAVDVTEVMAEFKQGTITLTRTTPGTPNPETPWIPGTPTTATYTLDATVAAVTVDQANAQFIDGTTITTADLVVTCAVPAVTPQMSDTLSIDGHVRTIKKVVQLPASGVAVAYKLFVQG